MTKFLILIISIVFGFAYFVIDRSIWVLAALFVFTILTRFRSVYKPLGKFIEMLFIFCLISTAINELGIYYPYSLIIVLALLIVLIFYEGPEWGRLYFGFGKTREYFKSALLLAGVSSLAFIGVIFLKKASIQNPVPFSWPLDVLIIAGIGFAFYLAIMEEMIFRSFLFERAESAAGGVHVAIWAQAAFYGLMCFRSGVPGNIEGIILGALFGIGLGYLVKKSESIYLAILVHFIVTFVIFIELTILGKF